MQLQANIHLVSNTVKKVWKYTTECTSHGIIMWQFFKECRIVQQIQKPWYSDCDDFTSKLAAGEDNAVCSFQYPKTI